MSATFQETGTLRVTVERGALEAELAAASKVPFKNDYDRRYPFASLVAFTIAWAAKCPLVPMDLGSMHAEWTSGKNGVAKLSDQRAPFGDKGAGLAVLIKLLGPDALVPLDVIN